MKLNIKAVSLTVAIFWGGSILLVGLANLIWTGYGVAFLEMVASIYPGYQATPSFGEVIVGTIYGLVDGFICGLIVAWLYNLFLPKISATS
ncbi:hypothetical protein MYX82_08495 [Acidobacteria bacterium AH-259-D05]|nr:hypothetical protein [Acidobacteria bacterium AH-259-D05]